MTFPPTTEAKILTVEEFIDLTEKWADSHLAEIANAWAMRGEGWEDWLRIEIGKYIVQQHVSADLGGFTRRTYTNVKQQCDFVLNDNIGHDKVVVEFKAQSVGRLSDFRSDFKRDVARLDNVSDDYVFAGRLAVAFFFTKDVSKGSNTISSTSALNFAGFLDDYDRVFLSAEYEPLRLAPGGLTPQIKQKTNIPKRGTTSPESTYEIGFVWTSLGPKECDGDVSDMETGANSNDT
jgi:hypothetical protein